MINLLPTSEKEHLLDEEKSKLIFIAESVFLFFLIALILVFVSIKISVASQVEIQKILLAQQEQNFAKTEIKDFKQELQQTNNMLSNMEGFYKNQVSFIAFLSKISNLLPKGISLNQILITPVNAEEKKFQITFSGNASLVEDLVSFRQNLSKEQSFSQINFPSSVWVETQNIDFNISFQAVLENE